MLIVDTHGQIKVVRVLIVGDGLSLVKNGDGVYTLKPIG